MIIKHKATWAPIKAGKEATVPSDGIHSAHLKSFHVYHSFFPLWMSSDKRKEAVFIQSRGRSLQGGKHAATQPPGIRHVPWPAESIHDLQMVGRVCLSSDRNQGSSAGKVCLLSHGEVGRGHGL